MTAKTGPLFAFGRYVTDQATFRIDEHGTRHGNTPNFALLAESEAAAQEIAAHPDTCAEYQAYRIDRQKMHDRLADHYRSIGIEYTPYPE